MKHQRVLPSLEAIAEWLPRQRWFGAKTRRIAGVTFADAVPLGPGVVLIVDVELDGGGSQRYAAPSIAGSEIRDALDDARFVHELVALVARSGAVASERGELRGVPAPGLGERWPAGPPAELT